MKKLTLAQWDEVKNKTLAYADRAGTLDLIRDFPHGRAEDPRTCIAVKGDAYVGGLFAVALAEVLAAGSLLTVTREMHAIIGRGESTFFYPRYWVEEETLRLPNRQLAWVKVRNSWQAELGRYMHHHRRDYWEFFGETGKVDPDDVTVIKPIEAGEEPPV